MVHGGPKFGPLSPPSRDSICMPSQVWSTDFLFEIFDHMINSRRIRRFGPYSNSSNTQVWSIFLFELDRDEGGSGPNLGPSCNILLIKKLQQEIFKVRQYFWKL